MGGHQLFGSRLREPMQRVVAPLRNARRCPSRRQHPARRYSRHARLFALSEVVLQYIWRYSKDRTVVSSGTSMRLRRCVRPGLALRSTRRQPGMAGRQALAVHGRRRDRGREEQACACKRRRYRSARRASAALVNARQTCLLAEGSSAATYAGAMNTRHSETITSRPGGVTVQNAANATRTKPIESKHGEQDGGERRHSPARHATPAKAPVTQLSVTPEGREKA